MIIAHLFKEDDNRWKIQSNEEHCAGVAGLASRFAGEFGMSSWGGLIGFLHDKGKESNAFQQHIKKVSGYSPEVKVIAIIIMPMSVAPSQGSNMESLRTI